MSPFHTLDCIEINPTKAAKISIIWLHGLGADKYDFVPVADQLGLTEEFGIRFIFPQAPTQAVTLNGGMHMPSWFDIMGIHINAEQDHLGIIKAQQGIEKLIEKEHEKGIPFNRIFLAGFSQGGALALQTGLRYRESLGGIIALSTFLPVANTLIEERSSVNYKIPIFLAHGKNDPLLPVEWAELTFKVLKQLDYPLHFTLYPMEHTVCNEEIDAIATWLRSLL